MTFIKYAAIGAVIVIAMGFLCLIVLLPIIFELGPLIVFGWHIFICWSVITTALYAGEQIEHSTTN